MYLENIPLHAAVEMGGAIIAVMVAYLLILLNSTNRGSSHNYSISAALLAMGCLDGLHSIMPPGNSFVWLHCLASLIGGIFFASVWFPESMTQSSLKYLPIVAISVAVLISILSFVLPSQIPLMISLGSFTPLSKLLSISSGLLMLLAAFKLFLCQSSSKKNEDRFFSLQCVLFGFASLLLTTSELWDSLWWGWHFMRFIAYALALWLVVENVKEMVGEIHKLAFYDSLTGLANRSLLVDRLQIALLTSSRKRQFGAILFIDIDKFKMINDTLGHGLGDMLLKEVANRLMKSVRKVDTVARIGGDEFAIFVENLGENEGEASRNISRVSDKILTALAQEYNLGVKDYFSSASIGVNLFYGNDKSVDELINHADMAMYKAKSLGRNRVKFFDIQLQKSVENRAVMETDIRLAITNNQLELYYQIQINNENRPIGAEALLRWIHPERGLIPPSDFIPIAEESTLINDLGAWVLNAACKQLVIWKLHEQTSNLVLAVNISAVQFKEPDFVELVKLQIDQHRINPLNLKLELTESVALDSLELVVAKMTKLKQMGISLSLDDFGTGYSSLSYLKQLPFDQIKIDQKFISNIATDSSDAVMVKTIIGLANNFKMSVIAEGVETDQQLAFLKQYGCNLYQGYFFSKPIPIRDFEVLIGCN